MLNMLNMLFPDKYEKELSSALN